MSSNKVLVTGAGGFIGRFLQQEGLRRGHEVYGSFRNSSEENLLEPAAKGFFLEFSERESLRERLINFAKETGGFEYVIHCAGITKPDRIEEFYEGNVLFTEFFVKTLKETQPNFKKFIFISSLQANGPGDPVTMEPTNEESIPKPFTPYGISKYEAEKRIMAVEGLEWVIFRPTSVYGPRDTKFIHQVLKLVQKGIAIRIGPKGQVVTFIYVKDLARLLWDAVDMDVKNEIFVVSDGKEYDPSEINTYLAKPLGLSLREIKVPRSLLMGIAHVRLTLAQIRKKPLHLSPFKVREVTSMNWRVDNSKICRVFNFEPKYSLEEGLKDALKEDGFIK